MNRRKPQPRYAVLPVGPGEDLNAAVLRKSAAQALASLQEQTANLALSRSTPFVAGYVLGYARQAGLKHGVDCEDGAMTELVAEIARQLPASSDIDLPSIEFSFRDQSNHTLRSRIFFPVQGALAEAGYLVGQLEALCGINKLLRTALLRLNEQDRTSGLSFITDCDVAADPMQTRMPTASLRFDADERAIILKAFTEIMK
jgi:hypothetical protein